MYNALMKKKILLIIIITFVILSVALIYTLKQYKIETDGQAQTDGDNVNPIIYWNSYTFEKIGLTLSVPSDVEISNDLPDEDNFTFIIQRGTYPDSNYYQLYATLQPNGTWDKDSEGLKSQLLEGSKNLTVGGFEAIQGQYKGERNRYVTFIFTDMGILTLATSQPTPENEQLTNKILDTFTFKKVADEPATNSNTEKAVQEILAKKYNKELSEVKVTVTKEVPGYAAGSVLFGQGGPGEGGMWLAAAGNVWNVVWDGNGSIDCNKMREEFKFPDSILKPNFCD